MKRKLILGPILTPWPQIYRLNISSRVLALTVVKRRLKLLYYGI